MDLVPGNGGGDGNFLPCSLCVYIGRTQLELCSHIVKIHRNDANFIANCSVENCGYSTKNWTTFRKHMSRQHPDGAIIPPDENLFQYDEAAEPEPMIEMQGDSGLENHKMFTALYLLKLETEHRLSQKALNDVVASTKMCLAQSILTYRLKIENELHQRGINDMGIVNNLMESNDESFEGFETTYLRHSFFSKYCRYVAPEKVLMGLKEKRVRGHLRQVEQYGYIVPFRSSIKALLEMPEIEHFVRYPHFSNSEMLLDVCDGFRFKNSPLFQRNPSALQIIISHDDLELMNPLGAHIKKHKMSMFYYTIANIPPQHRSRLSFIQLLAVAKTSKVREFGAEFLLSDFIACLNEMQNGGMRVSVCGVDKVVEGAIVMCPCDTLAAQYLAGFKEGVGFALKICRTCNASRDTARSCFTPDGFIQRCNDEHIQRCNTLKTLSRKSRVYWSKMWGVNKESALAGIHNLQITEIFPHDPMHVLLEGIVPYVMALFLNHCIYVHKYFTLDWLNDKIKSYPYSKRDKSHKPETIDKSNIVKSVKLKQTSTGMLTLCYVFPHIVGNSIPNDDVKFLNLIRLIQIVFLSTSPYVDDSTSGELEQLIATHHTEFVSLYPKEKPTPKFHYLIHFPQQLRAFGPLRGQWCLRFEGKHMFFKNFKWKNTVNLEKSLAEKHQLWMAYKMISGDGTRSSNFLYEGDIVVEGHMISFSDLVSADLEGEFRNVCDREHILVPEPLVVYRCIEVQIHGQLYEAGCHCALLLDWDTQRIPTFALIREIIVLSGDKFFSVEILKSKQFCWKLNSYEVECQGNFMIVHFKKLKNQWPLPVYRDCRGMYISNRNCHFVEYLC